ncbi:MAG: CoA transferase [Thermodesulfobacteriota bacterium]|nr:CoA transferase [Thermodesulfobacteriota bacterium]
MMYPLEGIRILEWGIFHAGPGGTAILGDLGADVIKIEERSIGDPIRRRSRFGQNSFSLPEKGNLFFEASNRNKKSVGIDLNKEEGRKIVYRIIPHFDVFVTNLRRKTVEKMGMTCPILSRCNDRLVYASVSGYGPKGPDRNQGGFDFQGQARSGIMYSMGEPNMPPILSQFGLIDQTTAIILAQAIITALFMRERTGKGQEIQTSILGAALHLSYFNFLNALWLNQDVPRHERMDTDPTRNYYSCKDEKWFVITLQPGGDWRRFCKAIGHPELEKNPKFDTLEKRSDESSNEIIALLDKTFKTKIRDEWLDIFKKNDLFVCEVNRPTDLKDDPQVKANYIDEMEDDSFGSLKFPGFPVHFSGAQAGTRKIAPRLGENSEEILRVYGKYTEQEIAQLKKGKVIS